MKLPDSASSNQSSHQPNGGRNRFAGTGHDRPNFLFLFSDETLRELMWTLDDPMPFEELFAATEFTSKQLQSR